MQLSRLEITYSNNNLNDRQPRMNKYHIAGLVTILLTLGGILVYQSLVTSCSLRNCKLPEIMNEVASLQTSIENALISGSQNVPKSINVHSLSSKHLTFSHITSTGSILVEDADSHFIAVFEPILAGGSVKWFCVGQPQFIFDSHYPANINDCGKKYRVQ